MTTKQAVCYGDLPKTFLSAQEMTILARHLTENARVAHPDGGPPLEMLVAFTRLEACGELKVTGVRNGLSVLDLAERTQHEASRAGAQRAERNR